MRSIWNSTPVSPSSVSLWTLWHLHLTLSPCHWVGRKSRWRRLAFYRDLFLVPRVSMEGGDEKYMKLHSRVTLLCIIENIVTPPAYIIWYHNKMRIMPSMKTYRISRIDAEDRTVARLVIPKARQRNSGNYTCMPSSYLPSTSIILHILNGKLWVTTS